MLARRYEMPWRSAYEGYAGLGWVGGMAGLAVLAWRTQAPWDATCLMMSISLLLATVRLRQAWRILEVRASLSGRAMAFMTTAELGALSHDDTQVFLGHGFEWQPVHTQRLYELMKVDYREHLVSPWLLKAMGRRIEPQPDAEIGLPYMHGVEPQEGPLYRPLNNFEGGTAIVGTTQAGKGVAEGIFITQAVKRGDVVIVIDPKNSKRLKNVVRQACADYREPATFLEFHPAFPETGVRMDFLFNWQKPTELASHIQSIMPVDTTGSFSAFGWDAVNVVVQGLVDLEDRPNLAKLTKYIEGGIEPILERMLRRYFERVIGREWRDAPEVRKLVQDAQRGVIKRPSDATSAELAAFIVHYDTVAPARHDKVIDSLVRVCRHNREHYQKITANLLPILAMLTSGDLGRSLSPDPFDLRDTRPIMNFEKIERGGHVFYMCLDALPDPSVATAIAALALADLAARAGMRYNLGLGRRISLYVDEVANVMNQPLIEILNKGAESGIYTTVAMQTFADLARRLGSADAARMALGNLNNLIALRTKDRETQEWIVETFGKTAIHTKKVGLSSGIDSHLIDFSASHSTQVAESFEEIVPAHILAKLPNLQYFASVSGGRLIKGRFQMLKTESTV